MSAFETEYKNLSTRLYTGKSKDHINQSFVKLKSFLAENRLMDFGSMTSLLKFVIRNTNYTSQILIELSQHLQNRFDHLSNFDDTFFTNLNTVRDKYRNNAAHPGILTKQDADDCKKLMQETIFPIWVNSLQ